MAEYRFQGDFDFCNIGLVTGESRIPALNGMLILFDMSNMEADVEKSVTEAVRKAGIKNPSVKRGKGRTLDIFEDGAFLANIPVEVYIDDGYEDYELPGGGIVSDVMEYDWEQLDRLGQIAREMEAAA